jgi:hypothetical protein
MLMVLAALKHTGAFGREEADLQNIAGRDSPAAAGSDAEDAAGQTPALRTQTVDVDQR